MTGVITVCYGQVQEWTNRQKAAKEFYDGVRNCDGHERERYAHVFVAIQEGREIAWDWEEIPEGYEAQIAKAYGFEEAD